MTKMIDPMLSWEHWEGDNPLEKKLNRYLTRQFIWTGLDVPADECAYVAKEIMELIRAELAEMASADLATLEADEGARLIVKAFGPQARDIADKAENGPKERE